MAAYLALMWTGEAPPPVASAVLEGLPAGGPWSASDIGPGHLIFTRGPVRPRIWRLSGDRGCVIGDVFHRNFQRAPGAEPDSLTMNRRARALTIAQDLSDNHWGRYVALIGGAPEGACGVFRDPSGAVDAMAWEQGGVCFVATHLPDWLPRSAWPDTSIDWTQVAACLASTAAMAGACALKGLTAITPGALYTFGAGEQQLWRPADVARRAPPKDAARVLVATLDACVAALVGEGRVSVEISGGLDSAIVAGSVATTAPDRVAEWINYHAADRVGDERDYARDVAARWKVPLTEAFKPDFAITAQALASVSDGLRPGLTGKDIERDRHAATRIRETGVERVMTGQGGDMVFFQTPTPLVAVDQLRRVGWRALFDPEVAAVARWTRTSLWRIAGLALRRSSRWHGLRSVAGHPWLLGTDDLPPAKQAQIATLAQALFVNIEGLRGRAGEIVHPLLAQPVVELCLSIPVPDLALGGRDRGLARLAFAERLPPSIRTRRSKGELGAYYGRVVGASLEVLRPLLLDGRLASEGLLDRGRLEVMLTREHLVWRGDYSGLMTAAVLESWVRHWEARGRGART